MKHTKCYIPGYPRPQLVRKDWVNLNGEWAFSFGENVSEEDALLGKLPMMINVPFCYESELSGIGDTAMHHVVWYSRKISGKSGKRTILYFEGADYDTEVYVNGKMVGTHRGAYSRFSFDVTDRLVDGEGILTVKCTDSDCAAQVRGKQRWEKDNFGCWYVQTTGIYKTVWLEYVDDVRLTSLKITPEISANSVRFDLAVNNPSKDTEVRIKISYDGKLIRTASTLACDNENTLTVRLESESLTYQLETWSVWHPALYDVDIEVVNAGRVTDSVGSYFGFREYTVRDGKIIFNNCPFYAKLILDQGYWKRSGITAPSEEAIMDDIRLSKEMGFNGCRKHQKNEDERFYYYADIMGYTVWCELPSNHWFTDASTRELTREWMDIIAQNYSHPSLVTWVIFNESWGVRSINTNEKQQNLATGLYYLTKSFDSMRPVVSNDGWLHTKSDILTLHHYEQDAEKLYFFYDDRKKLTEGDNCNNQLAPFAEGWHYEGQPIILSEFGGTHYANTEGWGYGSAVKTDEEFLARFGSLVNTVKKMNISGFCYTQLTDVQQEVNGLLREDRTPKVPTEEIAKRL
ncbi:MAG: glycoside hydrolase family 2 [Lachnospiraceae bacterium]|nr:glycoside hydrolase family 2 [Lachnospiraceae bacterium]